MRAKKAFASSPLKKWIDAINYCRKQLGIKRFCAMDGSSAQGCLPIKLRLRWWLKLGLVHSVSVALVMGSPVLLGFDLKC